MVQLGHHRFSLVQAATYLFCDLSIKNTENETYYVMWFVLILVASVWTNAFVYMVFEHIIWRYKSDRTVLRLKEWHNGTTFVLFDILAFIVQIAGAASAADPEASEEKVMRGLHIYMGGVGIQEFFILGFCIAVLVTLRDLNRRKDDINVSRSRTLVWVLIIALFFITVSN
jgi:hypothetical protein